VLLGIAATAEVLGRLRVRRVTPVGVRAAGPVAHAWVAGSAGSGWQVVVLIGALALAATLPLALLRTAAAALAVGAACVLSLALFDFVPVAAVAAPVLAAYRLGRDGRQLPALILSAPFLGLALAGPAQAETRVLVVLLAALVPAAAGAGAARRARTEAVAHGAARQDIAGAVLEHTVRGERARIARELHDVVAHHVSMVAVQAETARLATPGMPAAGAQRLVAIGDTARSALTEMRRLLGVLREDTADDPPDRHPQPGLGQLNELLDEARDASGSGARLIVSGPVVTLDPGVELAAYRIVQEALTNVRRHAPGAAIDVELRYSDDALRLSIRDNGPGPPPADGGPWTNGGPGAAAGGHGLLGMRERAASVGGELRTGAASNGGFLVEAALPGKGEVTG
jgi:signal transduction histidine kinase